MKRRRSSGSSFNPGDPASFSHAARHVTLNRLLPNSSDQPATWLSNQTGEICATETIASGHAIRILSHLNRLYGNGNWRKLKGIASVRLPDGTIAPRNQEYEASLELRKIYEALEAGTDLRRS